MPSARSLPPPITASPALELTSANGNHRLRRIFVGPMPEPVVSQSELQVQKARGDKHRWLSFSSRHGTSDQDEAITQVIQDYAYQFFIDRGGREEDWGEQEERSIVDEMRKRWKETPWGSRWRKKKPDTVVQGHWVGSSFEVGDFLGVNVLNGEPVRSIRPSAPSSVFPSASHATAPTSHAETFVTAQSHLSYVPESSGYEVEAEVSPDLVQSPDLGQQGEGPSTDGGDDLHPVTSSTALLRPSLTTKRGNPPSKIRSEFLRPTMRDSAVAQSKSDGALGRVHFMPLHEDEVKSRAPKAKTVHYKDSPEQIPASPEEVLEREGRAVEGTSAGAAENAQLAAALVELSEASAPRTAVVMQDRMIVRVSYTKEELGSHFDETQNRSTHNLQFEDWAEFMVVWRNGHLELYEDYTLPCKEWISGHKHLAFVVPLDHPRTRLSLYSFTDLTFCLTCVPTPVDAVSKHRWHFRRAKEGSNIFIFKNKSHSRAVDWIYHIWHHLGNELPPSIEIRAPLLDTSVRIDIPDTVAPLGHLSGSALTYRDSEGYAIFNRSNLIKLCAKALNGTRDWDIIQYQLDQGAKLELAWRWDAKLDWVWLLEDANGAPRHWVVLAGLAMSQAGKPAHLEFRVGQHRPTHLHLKDGTCLNEPPGIEGYLDRIKPTTQIRQATYLSTHDGLLFMLPTARAHPPRPPSSIPVTTPTEDSEDPYASLRAQEIRRSAAQVFEARGVTDLRNIVIVRRASQAVTKVNEHIERSQHPLWEEGEEGEGEVEERDPEDDQDEGGETGLDKLGEDRTHTRVKRSFELVLKTGRVIRYEAYSRKVALEWIERLRALIRYWKKRHFIDSRLEMDVIHFALDRPRLTPHRRWQDEDKLLPPEYLTDPHNTLPYLSTLYNWCVLDGCRPITKTGRVYARQGLRGSYKLVQLFLVSGHIIQYRMRAGHVQHRKVGKIINLLDAYTASGVFAAQSLPFGQYNPNEAPAARRYQDGLESDDPEEDTLFVIYYYPHTVGAGQWLGDNATIPSLSADRKMMVFMTRSRLERDLWCWALNTEIEKLARWRKDREDRLRHAGALLKTKEDGEDESVA